jgi:HEPN domain-containing protein
MDAQKQIDYWRHGSEEDMDAAEVLMEKGIIRHALFFAELAVEKMIKAYLASKIKDIPPKTHDLLRLSDLAEIPLSPDFRRFLARFQEYCLEGRYPEYIPSAPSRDQAESEFQECREFLSWLKNQFK